MRKVALREGDLDAGRLQRRVDFERHLAADVAAEIEVVRPHAYHEIQRTFSPKPVNSTDGGGSKLMPRILLATSSNSACTSRAAAVGDADRHFDYAAADC